MDAAGSSDHAGRLLDRLLSLIGSTSQPDDGEDDLSARLDSTGSDSDDLDDQDNSDEQGDNDDPKNGEAGTDSQSTPGASERKKRRLRLAKMKKKNRARRAYEFSASSDVAGVLYLEVVKAVDLPPERNRGSKKAQFRR